MEFFVYWKTFVSWTIMLNNSTFDLNALSFSSSQPHFIPVKIKYDTTLTNVYRLMLSELWSQHVQTAL